MHVLCFAPSAASNNHWAQVIADLEDKLRRFTFARSVESKPDWEKDELAASIKKVERDLETARDRHSAFGERIKELAGKPA